MDEVKRIVKDILSDLHTAESDLATAKELIRIGEEAGIDVTTEKTAARDVKRDLSRLTKVLKKRLKS